MKNNRLKITEGQTVNTVELQDLLDFSSKVLSAILQLQNAALKFNNRQAMELATQLNTKAGEFHTMISNLVMESGLNPSVPNPEIDNNTQIPDASGEEEDTRQDLSQPKKPDMGQTNLESAKAKYLKRKKLKEMEEKGIANDVVIDLSEPFEKVINGLDDIEFSNFKSDVVSKLEDSIDTVESKVGNLKGDEFTKSITALSASKSPEDFDFALNQLYDFADKNEILVETVVNKKKKLL